MSPDRKSILIRIDPAVHDALAKWAADDLRSVNAQIEMLLRQALRRAGREPEEAGPMRRPGRPRRQEADDAGAGRPRTAGTDAAEEDGNGH